MASLLWRSSLLWLLARLLSWLPGLLLGWLLARLSWWLLPLLSWWLLWLSTLLLLLFPMSLGVSLLICHGYPVAGGRGARPTTCRYNEPPIKTRCWHRDRLVSDRRPREEVRIVLPAG